MSIVLNISYHADRAWSMLREHCSHTFALTPLAQQLPVMRMCITNTHMHHEHVALHYRGMPSAMWSLPYEYRCIGAHPWHRPAAERTAEHEDQSSQETDTWHANLKTCMCECHISL